MLRPALAVALFSAWWILLTLALRAITLDAGELPVDYRTYALAAERLGQSGSPYPAAETVRGTWQAMHESALAVFRPDAAGPDAAGVVSGPYLYPPGLALVLQQTGLTGGQFLVLLAGATIGLCLGWWRLSGLRSAVWLLPACVSIDLIAVFMGGNVEILLIALSLLACRLLWARHPLAAAPVVAAVLLVKPQFALLFAAFACLGLCATPGRRDFLRASVICAGAALVLIALDILRWPPAARADFLAYASAPAEFLYFALDDASQWPMRTWNRAPLQVFLNLGLPFGAAQAASIALYGLLLGISGLVLRGRALTFASAFALAYALLIVGRPITWALPMLSVFTLAAVWPALTRRGRVALVLVAAGVGLSHWVAFGLFVAGIWPGLLTLQTPALPWETLVILPGAWALVLLAARRQGVAARTPAA
ncbi:hypothetical protein [Oceanibium sediminis]|uniref:hypothetical protein n=1 Tax=Oceanibium sediminis TaxID=2026339 RepID=UPI0013008CE5|nr:hypothetical protein [Oceanibium sediminis]